jgi:Tol biopolymer transport system component
MIRHALLAIAAALPQASAPVEIVGEAALFAPGIASTRFSEIRLTISPDGRSALWFSRNRPGGTGGYDIWLSRRTGAEWGAATPVPFNSPTRDFDPAYSPDGRFVYFSSDRPGGLGGDDIYRVAVTRAGFGAAEHLGPAVNSAANEWAPMPSPDRTHLLFSSDRPGGAGRQDLYAADRQGTRYLPAAPLPGAVNTTADEFDATYLADNHTIVFARAPDLVADRIDLFAAAAPNGRYESGIRLPPNVNSGDAYGPMLDWSRPGWLTFSARRPGAAGMDLYTIRYHQRDFTSKRRGAGA